LEFSDKENSNGTQASVKRHDKCRSERSAFVKTIYFNQGVLCEPRP